jgi:glycerol-3-phosphate dehydrogenase
VLADVVGQDRPSPVRLVKGSHIVVPRVSPEPVSFIFQNRDRRVCFAIPYEEKFTLIGTTDEDYRDDPTLPVPTEAEESYLRDAVNAYLRAPIGPADIVWRFAGVRALYDDGASAAQDATRDYVLELDAPPGGAALLSVIGGKITTYRRLAEAALARLAPHLPPHGAAWTSGATLPGGDFPWDGTAELGRALSARYGFLPDAVIARLVRSYGTRAWAMLGDARGPADLGEDFGAGLSAREVAFLARTEWARDAADILWRRGKLGLVLDQAAQDRLAAFLARETLAAS